jgi:hypothetical protein
MWQPILQRFEHRGGQQHVALMAKFDDQDALYGLGVKGELKHPATIAEIVTNATFWYGVRVSAP